MYLYLPIIFLKETVEGNIIKLITVMTVREGRREGIRWMRDKWDKDSI